MAGQRPSGRSSESPELTIRAPGSTSSMGTGGVRHLCRTRVGVRKYVEVYLNQARERLTPSWRGETADRCYSIIVSMRLGREPWPPGFWLVRKAKMAQSEPEIDSHLGMSIKS